MDMPLIVTIGTLLLVTGFVLGIVVARSKMNNSIGSLRIDQSDPDGPYLFLELNEPIEYVMSQKKVVMSVEVKDYISHK